MSIGVALSSLFESAPGAVFSLGQLDAAFGDDVERIIDGRYLRELGLATEVLCFDCGSPHLAAVRWDDAHQASVRHCLEGGGRAIVEPDELRRFQFDTSLFVQDLAAALGIADAPKELEPGQCWRLGYPCWQGATWAAVLCRGYDLPHRHEAIDVAVSENVSRGLGLMIGGAAFARRARRPPKGMHKVPLAELVALGGDSSIVVDVGFIESQLGLIRKGPGRPGAPQDHPQLLPHIWARRQRGLMQQGDSAEADALLSDPVWAKPGVPHPTKAAMRMLVRRNRRGEGA